MAPATAHPPPLARTAICRHSPEVGAVCGKAARTDLCGGRGAISVPTATVAAIALGRQLSGDKLRFAAWNEFLPISMPTVAMVSIDLLEMAVLL